MMFDPWRSMSAARLRLTVSLLLPFRLFRAA